MGDQPLIEITVSDLDSEACQAVSELFDLYGWGGAVMEQFPDDGGEMRTCLKTYIGAQEVERLRHIEIALELLNHVRVMCHQAPLAPPVLRTLSETDWAEAWKAHYHVLHVGRRLVIKPSWETYLPQPHECVIEIDPGMAFGSGLHATTRLCLALLEEYLHPGEAVLDLGSGSGILAIAAARLGAAHVLALDNDPEAVRVARENVRRNDLESIVTVQHGTLASDGALQTEALSEASLSASQHLTNVVVSSYPSVLKRWDIILANLLAGVIIELATALTRALRPGGVLIASGIITGQSEEVSQALSAQGLEVITRCSEGEWVAICARRPGGVDIAGRL